MMSVTFDVFVQDKVATGEFWVFSASSVEWQYVLSEIGKEFFPNAMEELENFGAIVPVDQPEKDPMYWARKSMLPVEVLEKRLGVDAKTLKRASVIKLKPFPPEPVKPTVDYFGRA